jgi:hypothetical protein
MTLGWWQITGVTISRMSWTTLAFCWNEPGCFDMQLENAQLDHHGLTRNREIGQWEPGDIFVSVEQRPQSRWQPTLQPRFVFTDLASSTPLWLLRALYHLSLVCQRCRKPAVRRIIVVDPAGVGIWIKSRLQAYICRCDAQPITLRIPVCEDHPDSFYFGEICMIKVNVLSEQH